MASALAKLCTLANRPLHEIEIRPFEAPCGNGRVNRTFKVEIKLNDQP